MLAVTGLGMVSALGLDVVSSCAAARAGIRRISPIDSIRAFDEQEQEEVPIQAHQVPQITSGLQGYARLLQLAVAGVEDLQRNMARKASGTTVSTPERPGLVLLLPSGIERRAWVDQLQRNPESAEVDVDVAVERQRLDAFLASLQNRLLDDLVSRTDLHPAPGCARSILADQVGFIEALEMAKQWLEAGKCKTCWIGGVDSFLDTPTLEALAGLQVLRTPGQPAGAIPGEMACFIAVEAASQPSNRHSGSTAVIDGFGSATGTCRRFANDQPTADSLYAAITASTRAQAAPTHLVINLNGDPVRSMEWGQLLVRRRQAGHADEAPAFLPPLFFGEIGAATGPASVALVATAWQRSCSRHDHATICLSGSSPARGAVSMRFRRSHSR